MYSTHSDDLQMYIALNLMISKFWAGIHITNMLYTHRVYMSTYHRVFLSVFISPRGCLFVAISLQSVYLFMFPPLVCLFVYISLHDVNCVYGSISVSIPQCVSICLYITLAFVNGISVSISP